MFSNIQIILFFHIIWFRYIIMYIDNFQNKMNTMGTNVVNEIVLNHILCILLFFRYRQPFHWYIHNQSVLNRTTALPSAEGGWGSGRVKRATLREKKPENNSVCLYIYISNILYKHVCVVTEAGRCRSVITRESAAAACECSTCT